MIKLIIVLYSLCIKVTFERLEALVPKNYVSYYLLRACPIGILVFTMMKFIIYSSNIKL